MRGSAAVLRDCGLAPQQLQCKAPACGTKRLRVCCLSHTAAARRSPRLPPAGSCCRGRCSMESTSTGCCTNPRGCRPPTASLCCCVASCARACRALRRAGTRRQVRAKRGLPCGGFLLGAARRGSRARAVRCGHRANAACARGAMHAERPLPSRTSTPRPAACRVASQAAPAGGGPASAQRASRAAGGIPARSPGEAAGREPA